MTANPTDNPSGNSDVAPDLAPTELPPTAHADRLLPPANPVEPRARLWWGLQALLLFVPPLVVIVIVAMVWDSGRGWMIGLGVIVGVATLVCVVVEPIWRSAVHRWEVTEEAVYSRTGWWVREWRAAPISRIQTVDAVRGPLEQMMGLATLRITTASSRGAINIVGLDHVVAADLAQRLTEITQQTEGDAT